MVKCCVGDQGAACRPGGLPHKPGRPSTDINRSGVDALVREGPPVRLCRFPTCSGAGFGFQLGLLRFGEQLTGLFHLIPSDADVKSEVGQHRVANQNGRDPV